MYSAISAIATLTDSGTATSFISADEATQLLERPEASYRDVVRPYLTAADIADDPQQAPSRWVIDFGPRSLEDAARFPRR